LHRKTLHYFENMVNPVRLLPGGRDAALHVRRDARRYTGARPSPAAAMSEQPHAFNFSPPAWALGFGRWLFPNFSVSAFQCFSFSVFQCFSFSPVPRINSR
jgi:hypothetical protein